MSQTVQKNSSSIAGLIEIAILRAIKNVRTATVGKITAVNDDGTVNIQPLIKEILPTGNIPKAQDLPILFSIPVFTFRTTNFYISLPVAIDDMVLLLVTDRSIDSFLNNANIDPVDSGDTRSNNLNDTIAIPGIFPFLFPPLSKYENKLQVGFTSESNHGVITIDKTGNIAIESNAAVNVTAPSVAVSGDSIVINADMPLSLIGGMVGVGATAESVVGGDTMAIKDTKVFIDTIIATVAAWVNAGTATPGDITTLTALLTACLSDTVGIG